ncbi:MAG TPA: Mov34/MPN/PAD-1 family protein [Tepidisphaeraceae bacterium]|nr:Mov34/MPN/PAD-1 family protein [Tepidisphaeraceae bacterium]
MADDPPINPDLDAACVDEAGTAEVSLQHLRGARDRRFQVVFRSDVLEEIHAHGQSITEVEICGVLVGRVARDAFGPFLHITGSIRGTQAEQRAAQVTFTAETWEKIHAEMDQRDPADRIVGWYHTHPGFGIFLSGMDLFIQDNFFNRPEQVAFVYDPIGGDEGVFVWRAGRSVREPHLVEESSQGVDWRKLARPPADDPVRMSSAIQRLSRYIDDHEQRVIPMLAAGAFALSFLLAWAILSFFSSAAPQAGPTTQSGVSSER